MFIEKFFRAALPIMVVSILLFSAHATPAQGILREILGRMDTHYKALKSLKSEVARSQFNNQLKVSDNYEGKIVLVPGKDRNFSLRLDWVMPKEELISVVNGQYVLYVPGIKRAYTGNSNSKKLNGGGGGNVLKAMSMSEADLKKNYNVKYEGQVQLRGVEVWHLRLEPKAKADYKFAELWVDKDGMPRQGKVTSLNNDSDTFLLTSFKKNETIDRKIFKVTLPKGTEVIKQ
ncbi:MAG: LolA family protein [Blastocatellia bacterium]